MSGLEQPKQLQIVVAKKRLNKSTTWMNSTDLKQYSMNLLHPRIRTTSDVVSRKHTWGWEGLEFAIGDGSFRSWKFENAECTS